MNRRLLGPVFWALYGLVVLAHAATPVWCRRTGAPFLKLFRSLQDASALQRFPAYWPHDLCAGAVLAVLALLAWSLSRFQIRAETQEPALARKAAANARWLGWSCLPVLLVLAFLNAEWFAWRVFHLFANLNTPPGK